jgi:hypothetical protein
MAPKAAVIADETLDEGEVPLSTVDAAEDEGLSNGLGLERLIPAPSKTKVLAKKATVVEETDEPELKLDKTAEKKETPPKDPKTGRFLPKIGQSSDPPIEDAKEGDDSDTLKKRLKDTRDWASQVNKRNQELDVKLRKLEADHNKLAAQLAGTYVEPSEPTVDPVELARLTERTKISRGIAEQLYGHELVQQLIYDEASPYRQLEQADPYVKARVFQADQPVMEAIRQLKWKQFTDQYGTDPDAIEAKLREEIKAEFVKTLKEKGRSKRTVEDVGGFSDMSGSGSEDNRADRKAVISLDPKTLFPGFPTGHF